ncbi:gp177 [Listeria phage A511]|uniref:Gp177 n=2 Tax=Pecentumvirus TaxID=1857844 RepID=A8AT11_BPA51|nr:gp177 [Listeria phage A511]YP_007676839.1 hypothetical protein AG2_172A [Listeria phage vB_LmoM_AG20]YP_010843675.1 hypothetical protein PI27_gp108 [Listeria phage WIL-1]AAY52958.1 gp177 [Listeria phage A511]AFJ76108.1 hypothetical protein AG2_172A [Listeria phage vB_LmoM_AG20]
MKTVKNWIESNIFVILTFVMGLLLLLALLHY